jgi:hypothetical protein
MLWMPLKNVQTLLGVALVLVLVPTPMVAKCISLQLTLTGEIEGPTKDVRVIVEVTSATQGDPVTDVRQESSIEGSHFRVIAWFNTTSNVISRETCDRRPRLVTIKLMRGDQVLDRQTLAVETAFRLRKKGNYELKEPITLYTSGLGRVAHP